MPGQGTIVATGAIGYPAGLGDADPARLKELGVQKVMTMTSTYDHRVIQGAESGSFLRRIDQLLQGEDGFYEEVFAAVGLDGRLEAPDGAAPVTAAEPAPAAAQPAADAHADEALLQAVQAATSVVKAHRMHGHLAARLDPLGSEPVGDPALDPATVALTAGADGAHPGERAAGGVPRRDLRRRPAASCARPTAARSPTRSSTSPTTRRASGCARRSSRGASASEPSAEERRALLERLSQVEALESYLHKAFLGKKQFSIEGLDVLVPMLDETIELAAEAGAREVVLGMAHRGRLNVLAHTVGRPYETILVEFEGEGMLKLDTAAPEGGTGDVKYHYGASGTYKTRAGKGVTVTLSPNPSHLEYVNPVIEGRARADQTSRKGREPAHDPQRGRAGADPRRRRLPRPGRRGGDAQPPGARRLLDRRHRARDRQQPARLHHRPRRGPLDPLRLRPGQGLRRPDHPRERRRRGGLHRRPPGWPWPSGASSAATR